MSPMALLVDDDDDDDVKDKLWYVIQIEGNIWFDLLVLFYIQEVDNSSTWEA